MPTQPRDLPPLPAQLKAEAEWLRHDGQKDDYYWLLERLKCTADLLDSAINALTPPAARPDANGNTVEFTQSPVLVNQSAAQADCTRSHPHEGMGPMCELKTQIAHLTNENAHLKARPAQALADERVALQTIVAGALFDFAGYLTTLPKPISIGSSELASPMVELLTAWAALRGLSLDDADVSTWQARAALAQQAAQAPCGTVTAYEDSTGQHYQFTPSWGWVGTRRFDVFEAPPAQAQQSDRVTPEMFQQLQEQVKTLKEIGERKIDGCECSAEDACRFAMERDEARALVAELKTQQAAGVPEPVCPNCGGSGEVTEMSDSSPDAHEVSVICPHCGGNGLLESAYEGVVKSLRRMTDLYYQALPYKVKFQNESEGLPPPAFAAAPTPPAQAAADARDAERYRMVRRGQHWSVITGIGDTLRGEDLDAAIDAVSVGQR